MNKSIYILFLGILFSMSSCRKDFDTVPSSGQLTFSKQTVYLDTVFTDIGSSTYTLKVFNRSNKDITIPKIKLAKLDSKYRITVDGMTGDAGNQGKVFSNVELLAKDSLYIFIETTVNIAEANPTDFLYTDEIEFDSGSNLQKVNLVTLIQDAVFLYPEKYTDGTKESILLGIDQEGNQIRFANAFELNENDPIHGNELIFTKNKPYVIYGFAGIPNNKTLEIQAGAKVYFHSDSGMIVLPSGTIKIGEDWTPNTENPKLNEVTFEGDRLEPSFEDTPGQWSTILILSNKENTINHLTLKNASVGIYLQKPNESIQPKLTITNSQIYNCSNFGIYGKNAKIAGTNSVINYAGQACFSGSQGGNYNFTNCTFNNNWNSQDQVAIQLDNYEKDEVTGDITTFALASGFKNSIIYGSNAVEVLIDIYNDDSFIPIFDHCLLKFNDYGTRYANESIYNVIRDMNPFNNIINEDPKFKNANRNMISITEESAAIGKGFYDVLVPKDILGNDRPMSNPDIGAYQYIAN